MMQWSTLLFLASIDYALGSHGHLHAHARAHLKAHDVLGRRSLAEQIPVEEVIKVLTLTTTVYENCAPTRTIDVTTTIFQDWMQQPTTQSNTTDIDINAPLVADDSTTTIHMTTTMTGSASTESLTVSVADATAPLRDMINPEVEERPAPARTALQKPTTEHTAPAPEPTQPQSPQILPGLPDLPDILPATALPDLPNLDQALHPGDPSLPPNLQWTKLPEKPSTKGFGGRTAPYGTHNQYHGNTGKPWGSNIIAVSPAAAHNYKYVVQFRGSNTDPWTVIIWNKMGPDGKLDGWYGHAAVTFVLAPGATRYVAFDEDSEGAWGAAPGTDGLPTDRWGGYTTTWGEFTFGDVENKRWSGWDVSAIQAQIAHQRVQGMRICMADGKGCSIITPDAKKVVAAYTEDKRHHDGIGGAAAPGPVRLVVDVDYRG
ncbi:hypothetical protein N7492_004531 [Penicillium capsulatum]|uniref:Allergen Asp f 4 n=1 Tax=Penicillium capsulatum TaxID=69766 RepID=A0A9W9LR87_9EURO|nr:hypothetical protein N7492_004531 [Penicillium capsulatum]KAJ6136350.1 hypothetical protein N7512_001510 [Penicillium capsulatum]